MRDKIDLMRHYLLARPASSISRFLFRLVAVWPVWRSVVRLSAAGEGVFTDCGWHSQALFSRNVMFFSKNSFSV
ncbi:MAG: hypothetical protein RIG84_05260 [Roseovarius sp.]